MTYGAPRPRPPSESEALNDDGGVLMMMMMMSLGFTVAWRIGPTPDPTEDCDDVDMMVPCGLLWWCRRVTDGVLWFAMVVWMCGVCCAVL